MSVEKLSSWNDDPWVVIRATGDKLNELIDAHNKLENVVERKLGFCLNTLADMGYPVKPHVYPTSGVVFDNGLSKRDDDPHDEPTVEQRKPNYRIVDGDPYYFIDEFFRVNKSQISVYDTCQKHIEAGNFFNTSIEAKAARDAITQLLKGNK